MGKFKRQKPNKPLKRQTLSRGPVPNSSQAAGPTKKHKQIHRHDPTIPFSPSDHILLIGEGDLSFAHSLVDSLHCEHVIATVHESSHEALSAKYPAVEETVAGIEQRGGRVRFGVDVTRAGCWKEFCRKEKGAKEAEGKMDRIVFNFPHVGGKSRDVNRQVRYNQELLVSFFTHAIPCLSPRTGSSIIVTLFEGAPYTLWNIRDLARHSGLEVKESFKFQAKAYPGYKHARTMGAVKGKDGEMDGQRRGWKGEERDARSFVFVRKGAGAMTSVEGRKRKRESSESEGDKESEEEEEEEFGVVREREDDEESDENDWHSIDSNAEQSDVGEND